MHFTREPIIESILSARDGFKLVLKNSKMSSSAEISAEVIEIVSFAGSVFYRSQDRSKNFLVPAADFEIAEVKDGRLVLKNISLDKSNKLQNPPKDRRMHESDDELATAEKDSDEEAEVESESTAEAPATAQNNHRLERRRERRRNRRRRHSDDKKDGQTESSGEESAEGSEDKEASQTPMVFPTIHLIPPPTTLISQTLARYKEKMPEAETAVVEEAFNEPTFPVPLEPEDLV